MPFREQFELIIISRHCGWWEGWWGMVKDDCILHACFIGNWASFTKYTKSVLAMDGTSPPVYTVSIHVYMYPVHPRTVPAMFYFVAHLTWTYNCMLPLNVVCCQWSDSRRQLASMQLILLLLIFMNTILKLKKTHNNCSEVKRTTTNIPQ